jgi:hypothetical protein
MLIRRNDQIFLTLNGHYWPPGRTVLTNDAGHAVHVHVTNYQDRYYGGAATIRLYHVDPDRSVIDVETFAPYLYDRGHGLATVRASRDADRRGRQVAVRPRTAEPACDGEQTRGEQAEVPDSPGTEHPSMMCNADERQTR